MLLFSNTLLSAEIAFEIAQKLRISKPNNVSSAVNLCKELSFILLMCIKSPVPFSKLKLILVSALQNIFIL